MWREGWLRDKTDCQLKNKTRVKYPRVVAKPSRARALPNPHGTHGTMWQAFYTDGKCPPFARPVREQAAP